MLPVLARVHDGSAGRDAIAALRRASRCRSTSPTTRSSCSTRAAKASTASSYPTEWRDRLLDAGVLEPLERFALVDDLWASVLAGDATAAEFLACARRFSDETDPVVWRAPSSGTCAPRPASSTATRSNGLRAEIAAIVAPTMQRLGWDGRADDDRTRQLRGLLINVLGSTASRPGDDRPRPRDLRPRRRRRRRRRPPRSASSRATARADDFDAVRRARPSATANPQEQLRYLYALGDFPTEELVLRAAELALSDAVRAQNGPFVLQRALRNRDHGAGGVGVRARQLGPGDDAVQPVAASRA